MTEKKLENIPSQPTNQTKKVENRAEKEPKFSALKIAVCGPRHSGKTVFLSSLVERLPDGCNIFRACPDGEGDWSQSTDQTTAQKLREKGKFSMDFIDESVNMIRNFRNKILLVDTGGDIEGEDLPLILKEVDGVIILARPEATADWQELVEKNGKHMFGVLTSRETGETAIKEQDDEHITGTVTGLERGSKVDNIVINELADLIKDKLMKYCEDEKEANIRFNKLAQELGIAEHRLGGRVNWLPENLPAMIEHAKKLLRDKTGESEKIKMWGTAPGMVWGALTAALRPQEVAHHDPYKGYVGIPQLRHRPEGSDNLKWKTHESDEYSLVKYQIAGTHFGERKLDEVVPPDVNQNKGIVLSGRGPWWLTTAIQESYQDAPWIAWINPQESRRKRLSGKEWHEEYQNSVPAVIVYSRINDHKVGEVMAIPDEQLAM